MAKVIGGFVGFGVSHDLTGALGGFLVGMAVDSFFENVEQPQRRADEWQTEFSHLFIMLHAKFAKIDGQVTSSEVRAFQSIIEVPDDDMDAVRALYNLHRKSSDGFEHVAVRISEMLLLKEDDKRLVVNTLCTVGMVDGKLNLYQGAFIQAVGRILGFSDDEIDLIKKGTPVGGASYEKTASDKTSPDAEIFADLSALKVLGLKKTATREEVRKAYKKSIRLYHPDKLRGEGASEDVIRKAEAKLAQMNEAYAVLIKKL